MKREKELQQTTIFVDVRLTSMRLHKRFNGLVDLLPRTPAAAIISALRTAPVTQQIFTSTGQNPIRGPR